MNCDVKDFLVGKIFLPDGETEIMEEVSSMLPEKKFSLISREWSCDRLIRLHSIAFAQFELVKTLPA